MAEKGGQEFHSWGDIHHDSQGSLGFVGSKQKYLQTCDYLTVIRKDSSDERKMGDVLTGSNLENCLETPTTAVSMYNVTVNQQTL